MDKKMTDYDLIVDLLSNESVFRQRILGFTGHCVNGTLLSLLLDCPVQQEQRLASGRLIIDITNQIKVYHRGIYGVQPGDNRARVSVITRSRDAFA